jgi:hypothetical protein
VPSLPTQNVRCASSCVVDEILTISCQAESNNGRMKVFASSVRAQSDRPILAVEDIEHLIDNIECSTSLINIVFKTAAAHTSAFEACSHPGGAYVVTSHTGCNDDDERAVFE